MLGVLLGQAPGVLFAGELIHAARDVGVFGRRCSCGEPAEACPLWGPVRRRVWPELATARHHAALAASLERHAAFPRVALGCVRSRRLTAWTQAQRGLLDALAAVGGARVIVDSSKAPARALLLARAFPGRVSVLRLERAPEGLMGSWRTPNPSGEQAVKSAPGVVATYAWVLPAARLVARRTGGLAVRFEDLVSAPSDELARIGAWARLEVSRVPLGGPLPIGHVVTANRFRHAGHVVLGRPPPVAPDGLGERLGVGVMRGVRRALRAAS